MLIPSNLLVLAKKESSRIIVSCNTKTIAIMTKLIATLLTKNQLLTILNEQSKKQFTQYNCLHKSQICQNKSNF